MEEAHPMDEETWRTHARSRRSTTERRARDPVANELARGVALTQVGNQRRRDKGRTQVGRRQHPLGGRPRYRCSRWRHAGACTRGHRPGPRTQPYTRAGRGRGPPDGRGRPRPAPSTAKCRASTSRSLGKTLTSARARKGFDQGAWESRRPPFEEGAGLSACAGSPTAGRGESEPQRGRTANGRRWWLSVSR